jgi:hypothetical protein
MKSVVIVGALVATVFAQDVCLFEPDWRPTHSYETTVHINKNDNDNDAVIVSIPISRYDVPGKDYKNYILRKRDCQGDCYAWTPKAGEDYSATIKEQPRFIPTCLKTATGWVQNFSHKALVGTREITFEFGKMKQEHLQYSSIQQFEFHVSYNLPVQLMILFNVPDWESTSMRLEFRWEHL